MQDWFSEYSTRSLFTVFVVGEARRVWLRKCSYLSSKNIIVVVRQGGL